MPTNLMRWVDRWIGSFCCALLSAWRLVLGRTRPADGAPRNIVFIALAEVGALVLAYPAIARTRRLFPDSKLHFVTFAAGTQMLDVMGFAAETRIILDPSSPGTLWHGTWAALAHMRAARIDTVVVLEVYGRFSTMLGYLGGARRRVGFHRFHEEGHYLGALYTHRVIYNPHMHIARSYVALVEAMAEDSDAEPRAKVAIPADLERLRWQPPEDVTRSARDKLARRAPGLRADQRIVILNANASDLIPQRRWAAQKYVDVARRLLADERVIVVLSGSAGERAAAEAIGTAIGSERAIVLAGETSLTELIALFGFADLLITNDSGPAHFASLTDLPTLVLFGPETPRIFGPLGPHQRALYAQLACSPCVSVYNQKRSPCGANECMRAITPESVYAAAQQILLARRS